MVASREYNGAPAHADPFQAVGLLQRLRARGVRASEFTFSAQSVGRVANALHLALRNRLILLPDDQDLRSELGRVRLRESAPGVVRLDHDRGDHDDQAVAIAIAVSVLQGEARVGAGFMAAYKRELEARGPQAPAALRSLPRHLAADDVPQLRRGCRHRYRVLEDGRAFCVFCHGQRLAA